ALMGRAVTMNPRTEVAARTIAPIVVGLVVLGGWQLAVTVGGVDDYLLPAPASIIDQLVEFAPSMLSAGLITGTNALIGLLVGAVLGIVVALFAASAR